MEAIKLWCLFCESTHFPTRQEVHLEISWPFAGLRVITCSSVGLKKQQGWKWKCSPFPRVKCVCVLEGDGPSMSTFSNLRAGARSKSKKGCEKYYWLSLEKSGSSPHGILIPCSENGSWDVHKTFLPSSARAQSLESHPITSWNSNPSKQDELVCGSRESSSGKLSPEASKCFYWDAALRSATDK